MKTLKRAQPAAAMPDEIEGLRAHVALLKSALAQSERENDELRRAQPAAATVPASDEPPFLQRLRDEVRELNGRLEKLEAFIPTAAFSMLDDTDRVLLQRQANQMHALAQTLNQRIHNAAEKHRREAGSPQGGAE